MLPQHKIAESHPQTETTCAICGTDSLEAGYPSARDYVTGDEFQVRKCRQCGLGVTAPQPANMEPYYPPIYRRYSAPIIFILKTLYRLRVSHWTKQFAAPGEALEIGCGDGFMLDSLRRSGWKVAGTERTDEMARYAREHFGTEMFIGGPENVPENRKFDLVILFQVLEHMDDPLPVLRACVSRLKPGGKIVIGVPNFGSLQSRYARSDWFHLDVPRHLFHFTPESLQLGLRAAGAEPIGTRFFSPEHDPFGWMQSILNRQFGNKNSLVKLLMRSRRPEQSDVLLACLVALLAIPSVLLALATWLFGSGAIIEITAEKR